MASSQDLSSLGLSRCCALFFVAGMFLCATTFGSALETKDMKAPTRGLHQVETPSSGDIASAPLQTALLGSVRFFQKWISPIDGPRCSFSPTCSRFGFEAVHDHGSLMGVIMTADRLMRCSYWPGPGPDYPRLANGSLYDPVVINLSKHP